MRKQCKRLKSTAQGAATIEFALVAMFLITLLLGAVEVGRAVWQYNIVAKNVRAAARHLTSFAPGSGAAATTARNLVVYGAPTALSDTSVVGLNTGMVTIQDASTNASHKDQPTGYGIVSLVTVNVVGLQFQPIATWILPAFTFDTISVTMRQS